MEIGAQLYSLRDFIKTRDDVKKTFEKVGKMGYTCVQFSGADIDAEGLKAAVNETGIPVYLTHVAADRILNDTDKLIAEHKAFGCRNIGLGSMPGGWTLDGSVEQVDDFIRTYAEPAKKIADAGMKLFYHNHAFEFMRLSDGGILFDRLIEKAPYLNFTLDTYWVQRGGGSILGYIDKLKGRLECVHLKDMRTINNDTQKFAPVGEGAIDFAAVLPAFEKAGTKYAFVEQDDAVEYPDPFGQLKISADNLKKLGYIRRP